MTIVGTGIGKKKLLKPKPPDKHSIFCLPEVKIALFKKNSSILIKTYFQKSGI